MMISGFASRYEVWLALITGIACLVVILYAMEVKKTVEEIDKWKEEIKFEEWLKKNKKR